MGEIEIRDPTGATVPVRDVLDRITAESFASVEEAVSAICAATGQAAQP